ncbi:serine hydrolase domain-containing protein [Mucilaginibacter sabulilitoris]|uniref:Serine hydrolase domain-containing protein n=1 Tax=Mucilaginibacter sabulilitoris TaxID=1173583 RepID=A0ABZ0TFS6_9SPHI|nr:serine hydrolase domain-containing protein [Mucilaginibacter sabulilitoris]WPU92027.1 serine hydrolase domain-containing protein [Mucilaginibacter sabulilitoris]
MRKPIILFAVVIGVLIYCTSVSVQPISKTLERYYSALQADYEMNGNVLAAQNDHIFYQQSFGYRDMAAKVPNDAETQFELASVSKLFTVTVVLQLKEKGLVILYSHGHILPSRPGEKWSYSSLGYHFLALLVEKVSGQTLAAYTRDHIFLPAGMNNSYIQTSLSQKLQPRRTKNYQYNNHYETKLQLMDTLNDWKEWTHNLALMTGGSGINILNGKA